MSAEKRISRIMDEIPEYDDYFNDLQQQPGYDDYLNDYLDHYSQSQPQPQSQSQSQSQLQPQTETQSKTQVMTPEDVINFAYVLDPKTKGQNKELSEIEFEMIWAMKKELDGEKLRLLYQHHLDLFIKYDKLFLTELKKSGQDLLEYTKMKQAYVTVDNYFNGLKTHNMLSGLKIKSPKTITSSTTSSPLKSPSVLSDKSNPDTLSSPDKRGSRSSLFSSLRRSVNQPAESIFTQVEPKKFAEKCHKLFVYCYFAQESRELQYQSRHSGTETSGYAKLMKGIFNNFLLKLLNEVDIYCRAGRTKRLVQIFSEVVVTLFGLGNLALGKLVMYGVEELRECQPEMVDELKAKIGDKRQYEKYPYLVDPAFILMNFIHALENPYTTTVGTKIHNKILETKRRMVEEARFVMQAEYEDFVVYSYLQPEEFIDSPLYVTNGKSSRSKCIVENCGQRGGFDKSSAKYPRRYSKEYCTSTPCHKMGFTQKASCRYYKNCYK